MTVSMDWWPWYRDLLDGLVTAIEGASIQWAADATGDPWVVQGQRRPTGIDYPHAMILQFQKQRDEAESKRRHELHRVNTTVSVFREGDPKTPEQNLRQAVEDMAAVETALYDDRTLGGACDTHTITESNAFSLENASGTTETVGDIQLTITKQANQPAP
jgi:hypothetical protein